MKVYLLAQQIVCIGCNLMTTLQPTQPINWWDIFYDFYFNDDKFPFGLSLWCFLYGIAILAVIYLISFEWI